MATAKYKKGSDGYFRTKVWDGTYTKDGRKHRICLKSNKSSKDLENQVIAHNNKLKNREYVRPSDITFYDYAKLWKDVWKNGRSKNTIAMYTNIIDAHFAVLSHVRLLDINRLHYQTVINNASGKDRTCQQIYMTFKQVIQCAVSDKLLPRSAFDDIFENVEKVSYKSDEKRPLTDSEKKAVFSPDLKLSRKDKAFLYILYGCGVRRGEALALSRFDVLLKTREISINKAVAFDGNNPYTKSPKTKYGTRKVPIPPSVFPFIEDYVKCLNGPLLFPMRGGAYTSKSSYDKIWMRIVSALTAAGADNNGGCNLTAHIFRHNYCTNLCYKIPMISIKKIAQLMGDTEAMVLNVYNHIMLEKEDAATAVAEALEI